MFRRSYIPKVLYSEGSILQKVLYSEGSMFRNTGRFYILKVLFRNFGFCSQSSSDAVVDDMDEIERVSESK